MPQGFSVVKVEEHSPARLAGLEEGDRLLEINGSCFYDLLDYYYLCADTHLVLKILKNGTPMLLNVDKGYDDALGLEFSSPTIGPLRRCHNNCIFCFIDQQPPHLRSSLFQKDDDYRLSFLHGNYITMTNVNKGELRRIIRRSISPLYISIHATNPELRRAMMGNRAAGRIMNQLNLLAGGGITMHGQVVICPGYNDGAVLLKTVRDLARFYPRLKTVALVPVGLTRYRDHLTPLRPVTSQSARQIVKTFSGWQKRFQKKHGTPFVYLADEFYLLSGSPLPPHHHYGAYEQLENGVGLLRLFLNDLESWKNQPEPVNITAKKTISCVTGKGAAPFLQLFMDELAKVPLLKSHLHVLSNHFWGGNVNVAGLLSGSDLLSGLQGKELGEILFITSAMLKEGSELFLDGYSLAEVSAALKTKIIPVESLLEIMTYLK